MKQQDQNNRILQNSFAFLSQTKRKQQLNNSNQFGQKNTDKKVEMRLIYEDSSKDSISLSFLQQPQFFKLRNINFSNKEQIIQPIKINLLDMNHKQKNCNLNNLHPSRFHSNYKVQQLLQKISELESKVEALEKKIKIKKKKKKRIRRPAYKNLQKKL